MTIVSSLKDYLITYPNLREGAQFGVDFIGPDDMAYSLVPLPGDKVLESYIDGGSMRVYPFAFQSTESTADELARLDASGFYEALVAWFESQTLAGILPVLDAGKSASAIEATGYGYLYQDEGSGLGLYQVQCRLVYEQVRPQ